MADVFLALVHYPVYNKRRDVIASALTTIDIHDLARLAATYDLAGVYLVTPLADQLGLAQQMIDHWSRGWGLEYNRNRAEALTLVRLARDLAEAEADITATHGRRPMWIGTSAGNYADSWMNDHPRITTFKGMVRQRHQPDPWLILLGTAWGLTDDVLARCDVILEPIKGSTEYNHLSVRSAASIIVDRLLGHGANGGIS
ncbi:MAG: RNA methyltransferase [Deltaproteobacteria bacterium]|nr:RNA methyltransferase [Deltaproteobacteria bacterium]